ncbi:LicD family-domain-containing protein [Pseudoneurospora amorphoporcata]|uniref:LicD family-domain-containing protein n=1 Tax=Pseudoneurospora amorphoporcata TaxID=241081 RepID=A0AAN6P0L7_9PEZI|nr:LicD family-domain-containing protein [Pseudoneurospora amorphoporcata]
MSSSLTAERRQSTTASTKRRIFTLLMTLTLILSSLANPVPIEGHNNLPKPPVKQNNNKPAVKANDNDSIIKPKAITNASSKQVAAAPAKSEPQPIPTAAPIETNTTNTDHLLPEHKYFHEPGYTEELSHYDSRFFASPIPYDPHIVHLRHLIRSYLLMTSSRSLTTWLAHGTLLGWYWNGAIMPWDYDLDVQVSNSTLGVMAAEWNGTTFEYVYALSEQEEKEGLGHRGEVNVKKYVLDVNPYWSQRTRLEGLNIIDARWIDIENGMYVDITGLSEDRLETKAKGVWTDKNYHGYGTRQIWPLRKTEFEGVEAWVPSDVEGVLEEEYGERSLTAEEWAGHHFDHGRKEWVKTELVKKGS